jgi:hypothetical protein
MNSIGRVARCPSGLAVEVYQRAEAARLAADDRDHEREAERARADEGFGRAAYAEPDGQGILQRARVDALASEWGAKLAGPGHVFLGAQGEEELEFFGEEGVVVLEF